MPLQPHQPIYNERPVLAGDSAGTNAYTPQIGIEGDMYSDLMQNGSFASKHITIDSVENGFLIRGETSHRDKQWVAKTPYEVIDVIRSILVGQPGQVLNNPSALNNLSATTAGTTGYVTGTL